MADETSKKWRNLTHSQRVGKAPLPEALQAGKLTTKFKNQIWYVIANSIDSVTWDDGFNPSSFNSECAEGKYWSKFYSSYRFGVKNITHDEISTLNPWEVKSWLKDVFFKRKPHEIITLLEYMLRISSIPKNLASSIEKCFKCSPYLIDRSSEPVCAIPTTSEEMKKNTQRALNNINQSELTGAKSHLCKAAQELNNNKFADSIRESIHAVESAVIKIDPKESKDFSVALNYLKKNGIRIHPALKEGFNKLYGYTSDEQGIRHALIDDDAANVGFDEAIFMYGTCVSFVDYLVSKKRQMEEK